MLVFKVLRGAEWRQLEAVGEIAAAVDLADGFVHLSTGDQLPGTLGRHFAGETGLWLVACEADDLGDALRWEPSRGGALFPHLHRRLARADVLWARLLEDGSDGLA
jgi:uncharacterized protein (DUF952 family)